MKERPLKVGFKRERLFEKDPEKIDRFVHFMLFHSSPIVTDVKKKKSFIKDTCNGFQMIVYNGAIPVIYIYMCVSVCLYVCVTVCASDRERSYGGLVGGVTGRGAMVVLYEEEQVTEIAA